MNRLRTALIILAFFLCSALSSCGGAGAGGSTHSSAAAGSTPGSTPGPQTTSLGSPFGIHPALPFEEATNIGVAWTRGGVSPYLFWALVDPDKTGDPSKFQWKGVTTGPEGQPFTFDYDALLQVQDAGLNMMQNISVQPDAERGGYSLPGSWIPINEAAYRTFVKEAVRRYSFIRYWQVWNEPNQEITRSLTDYASLQRITCEAIKEQDPDAHVIMAGLAGNMDTGSLNDTYYESILPALGGKYMEIYDVHYYGDAKCGTTVLGGTGLRMLGYREIKEVYAYHRNLLDKNGFSNVPIWVTEMGTPSCTSFLGPFSLTQSEAEQARDLLKRWVYPLALGIRKVFWAFGLTEGFKGNNGFFDHTGLIYGTQDAGYNPGEKKLSYYTHRLMTEKLEGSDWNNVETISEDDSGRIYVYRFRKGAQMTYVAWWDYFNDPEYPSRKTREIVLTGLQGSQVSVTEAVPRFSSGSEVADYDGAFKKYVIDIVDQKVTLTLGEDPQFVE